ncbi:6201_t:CDS:2, partial [Racocetra persica]
HASSANKNDTVLLDAYQLKELYSQYIIRVAGKYYIVIDYLSKIYRILDTYEYIDRNQPLRLIIDIDAKQKSDQNNFELPSLDSEKIICGDLMSQILVACIDTLSLIPDYYRKLKGFTEKVIEFSWKTLFKVY